MNKLKNCCVCEKELENNYFMDGSSLDNDNRYCKDCIGNLIWGKKLNDA